MAETKTFFFIGFNFPFSSRVQGKSGYTFGKEVLIFGFSFRVGSFMQFSKKEHGLTSSLRSLNMYLSYPRNSE